ncbi:MAG: alkaline phosphatase D family protein [Planctomycetaceae bacterium]
MSATARRSIWIALAGMTACAVLAHGAGEARAAHMATGFKVGEVTQNTAIVWTRLTKNAERNWDGVKPPRENEPYVDEYIPSPIAVDDRVGAVPGIRGRVRVSWGTAEDLSNAQATDWVTLKNSDDNDFIHQFRLSGLKPATKYYLKVEARPHPSDGGDEITASLTGSFATPAENDQWQDVKFGVITGQNYWRTDHKDGFEIYPAMRKMEIDFLVPTGDTVYLDAHAPRARTVELARHHWHRMYSLPRLAEFHRFVPGYWEVDDHDAWTNDCWPTKVDPWMNPLTFADGFTVFRKQAPMGNLTYRTVRWGKGLQVWMVEGRLYRSSNRMEDGPEKTIWGHEQRDWLMRTILESDADFKVLVSPTPIVGPDRGNKNDNHANRGFTYEGDLFRNWTKEKNLENLYVCNGDRHWQYMSVDPKSGLREFSCGPASDAHAGGAPEHDPEIQPFLRVKGGFLSVEITRENGIPTIAFIHRDVHGEPVHEFRDRRQP